jgi:hypothetical protein
MKTMQQIQQQEDIGFLNKKTLLHLVSLQMGILYGLVLESTTQGRECVSWSSCTRTQLKKLDMVKLN